MRVPAGKKLVIKENGETFLPGIDLILNSELNISLQSRFSPIIEGDNIAKLFSVGSNIAQSLGIGSFSGKFKEMGFEIWQGTEPVAFTFDISLYMKTSGRTDVLEPAKKLMGLPLPREGKTDQGEIGLVAPGPSILEALNPLKGIAAQTNIKVQSRYYSVRVGMIYLPSVIIESVEPTWSMETDEDNYPVWCQLKIDGKSIFTATQEMINNFGPNDLR